MPSAAACSTQCGSLHSSDGLLISTSASTTMRIDCLICLPYSFNANFVNRRERESERCRRGVCGVSVWKICLHTVVTQLKLKCIECVYIIIKSSLSLCCRSASCALRCSTMKKSIKTNRAKLPFSHAISISTESATSWRQSFAHKSESWDTTNVTTRKHSACPSCASTTNWMWHFAWIKAPGQWSTTAWCVHKCVQLISFLNENNCVID